MRPGDHPFRDQPDVSPVVHLPAIRTPRTDHWAESFMAHATSTQSAFRGTCDRHRVNVHSPATPRTRCHPAPNASSQCAHHTLHIKYETQEIMKSSTASNQQDAEEEEVTA